MPLIEGIGDEVVHFFVGLAIVTIVTVAWLTTSIAEHRYVQTVWLLDRRRSRLHRRLTNHTHSVTITEGTLTATSPVDESELAASTNPATPKPPEAGTSNSESSAMDDGGQEEEQSRIVETMDADASVLRQRRVAFYNRTATGNRSEEISSTSETAPMMEHDFADKTSDPLTDENAINSPDIRIKLKYINDDLKLVNGKLQEKLGDFKKRHFQDEISSNKLVRLIFNGQVLHQDTKTLQGCGLFDNCVVHCLIHQRRPSPGEGGSPEARGDSSSEQIRNNPQNNQGRDWDFGNFLFALISFILLSAWYFRYVYAHLYTVTASVGLILMTVIFTIVLFGFYFPDQDHMPQHMENPTNAQT